MKEQLQFPLRNPQIKKSLHFIEVEETTGKFIAWPSKITEPCKNLPIDIRIKSKLLDLTSAYQASARVLLILLHNSEVTLTFLQFPEYARPFCFKVFVPTLSCIGASITQLAPVILLWVMSCTLPFICWGLNPSVPQNVILCRNRSLQM